MRVITVEGLEDQRGEAMELGDVVPRRAGPDTYELLVTRRGWSPADFADWATTSLTASLVRPGRPRSR